MQDIFVETIEQAIDIIEQSIQTTHKYCFRHNRPKKDLREYGRQNLKSYDYGKELGQELQFCYKQIEHYMLRIQDLWDKFVKSEDQLLNADVLKLQFQLISKMQSEIEDQTLQIANTDLRDEQDLGDKLEGGFQAQGSCKIIQETIQDWLEKLKLKLITLKKYVTHQENYQLIKSNSEAIDQQIEELYTYSKIFINEQQTIPIKEVWDKIVIQYQQFQYKFYDLKSHYGLEQHKLEKEFRSNLNDNKDEQIIIFVEEFRIQCMNSNIQWEKIKQKGMSLQELIGWILIPSLKQFVR
ncbi:unnamed protein product [Paramecium octaurelia]|uniref:Uncharacterized protein n=1 Tax=Paramecium octaurelia TaxID=43137 RepID=A0A8S1WEW8_PAROT|nr:unnamed protein product [Paramecium octaurelia]